MAFDEEDYLQLSGLQHFAFCCRQWALIHVENQWAENERTVEGGFLHERAHDEQLRERRGELLVIRGMRLSSARLGVSGACDVVEFRCAPGGVPLHGEEGLYLPHPVEYKHGQPREDRADALQLCAQAMCLEEMLCCDIPQGALYYGQTRHRQAVAFTQALRDEVESSLAQMHALARRGHTPKVKPTKACNACSLKEVCLPKLMKSSSVQAYIRRRTEDET
ncbi:MAG: CRISPR-associated protein Cas4 [Candidatus Spyradocola sp.]